MAARDRGEIEAFHDLAWRAVQTGPRNDGALMFLLARAQSVSGRAGDALVMLQRLAALDFDISETETSEDFRRVRNLAAWAAWKGVPHTVEPPPLLPPPTADATPAAAAPAPTTAAPETPDTPSTASAKPATPGKPGATRAGRESAAAPPRAADGSGVAPATPGAKGGGAALEREDPLPLPDGVLKPSAMAYDGVSGRLVLVDAETDTLKVLSELSGNAVNLVSRGWGGNYRTTAVAIDPARGDLWVTAAAIGGAAEAPSVVHRLQLVSGRLLYTVPAPSTEPGAEPDAELVSIAHSGNTVYALDAAGRRIFELATGTKTLRPRATFKIGGATSLAVGADGAAFVSHPSGVLRVNLANGSSVALTTARGVDISGLVWIARYGAGLLAIQRQADGSHAAVRVRLDASGRRATRLDVLGDAASPAATVMGSTFYFLAPSGSGGTVVERVKLK